jgi:hypothetical protein
LPSISFLLFSAEAANPPSSAPPTPVSTISAELAREARISPQQARMTALGQAHGGEIRSEGIERKDGRLTYFFQIQSSGRSGVEEVRVDATDGDVMKPGKTRKPEARVPSRTGPRKPKLPHRSRI